MDITCISDLHGFYHKLDGGDLLIVAGDLTGRDTDQEHLHFIEWIGMGQKYGKKYKRVIYIAGNHDNFLDPKAKRYGKIKTPDEWNIEHLCDSGTEFEGLKIWGSPWTKTFPNMNPKCKAFTVDTEEELEEKWKLIPDDIDILITHSPAYAILDGIPIEDGSLFHTGSTTLRTHIERIKLKLHVCGHIHEGYGQLLLKHAGPNTICVNASHVNERYKPVNKPIRIEL